MTLSSTTVRTTYSGDGATTAFPTGFSFWNSSELKVLLVDSSGDATEWTENTQYTVTGGAGATGTVTVDTSPTDYTPASGETLIILSNHPNTQTDDLATGGEFPSDTVEARMDKLTRQVQQMQHKLDNYALLFPEHDTSSLTNVLAKASSRASKVLSLDGSGNITTTSLADNSTDAATATSGTTSRSLALHFDDILHIDDFGPNADGATDDAAIIQAALDTGKKILLAGDTSYAIGSKLTVPDGGGLIGAGPGQYPPAAFITDADFIATSKTRIVALAGFTSGDPLIEVKTADSAKYAKQSVVVKGVMLDCANIATDGLHVKTVYNSLFEDLLVFRPTTRGILEDVLVATVTGTAQAGGASTITLQANAASTRDDLYNGLAIDIDGGTGSGQSNTISDYDGATQVATVSSAWSTAPDATSTYTITGVGTSEGGNANQRNTFRRVEVWCGNSGSVVGWEQNGTTVNNTNLSRYEQIQIVHADGDGMIVYNADSNVYGNFWTYSFGTGVGMRLKGNEKNALEYARDILVASCQLSGPGSGTGGVVVEGGTQQNSNNNLFLGYDEGNSTPAPTVQDGAEAIFVRSSGVDVYDASVPLHTWHASEAYSTGLTAMRLRAFAKTDAGADTEFARINAFVRGAAASESGEISFQTLITGGALSEKMLVRNGVQIGTPTGTDKGAGTLNTAGVIYENNVEVAKSSGTTGGAASAGAGNQYIEITVGGTTYKCLHDGTV